MDCSFGLILGFKFTEIMLTEVDFFDICNETLGKLAGDGILLLSGVEANPMTIGWGTLGYIWNRPVMTVLVRPVRYSFELMERSEDFSVCILPADRKQELAFCGTRSGRDMDKNEKCGFNILPGIRIKTGYIDISTMHFECRIVHKHRLDPTTLDPEIVGRNYPKKDFHMVYYGEILGIFKK